ncbi:MAG: hypothetical protein JWP88_850 [Flaviaesturariibacter sp.]|nr:hypothetical protein [Flaviaesturariibacter sp.]
MIQTIPLTRLSNADFIEFFNLLKGGITAGFEGATIPAPFAAKQTAVNKVLSDLEALHNNDPASHLTAEMLALDAERDSYIGGMSQVCRGHLSHPDDEMKGAAKLLVRSLQVHGPSIRSQGITEETATIKSILKDWNEKPEMAGAVAALRLGAWLTALERTNNNFEAKYLDRNLEGRSELPFTMKEKRQEARVVFDALMEKLVGYYSITEGDAPWKNIVSDVNALIDRYNKMLAADAGRAAAEKEAKP